MNSQTAALHLRVSIAFLTLAISVSIGAFSPRTVFAQSEDDGSDDYGYDEDYSDVDDGGYGSAYQRPGSGRAGRVSAILGGGMQMSAKALAEFINRPLSADQLPPLSLWDEAAWALHNGDQQKAAALFHAHLVAERDAAAESMAKIGYSRLLRRPTWAIRFGISMHARIPSEYVDDPNPLRTGMKIAGMRSQGSGAAGYASDDDGGDSSGLLARSARARRGAAQEYDEDYDSDYDDSGEDDGSYRPVAANARRVVTTTGGAAAIEVADLFDRNLGVVAEVLEAQLSKRVASGAFGHAFDAMVNRGIELATDRADLEPPTIGGERPVMWIPGIDFVGLGPAAEMLAKAKANEVDVLLHFEVIVKESRADKPQYLARGRLLLVETGETLVISKTLESREIGLVANMKKTDVRGAVEEQMKAVFEIIDRRVAVEPLPPLAPQHAASRIDALLASRRPWSPKSIAEIVMFHARGELITAEQLDQIVFYAGGEQTLRLLHDDASGRREAALELVERAINPAD